MVLHPIALLRRVTVFLLFAVEVLPVWTVNGGRKHCENWLKKRNLAVKFFRNHPFYWIS